MEKSVILVLSGGHLRFSFSARESGLSYSRMVQRVMSFSYDKPYVKGQEKSFSLAWCFCFLTI